VRRITLRSIVYISLLIFVLAACSPAASDGDGESGGPIRLAVTGGIPPDVTAHHYWFSEEEGFFDDAGVEVEIIPVSDDQISLRGLAAGEFDVSETGCTAAMQAIEVGAPLRFIGAVEDKLDYGMVAVRDITSPSETEGRALGVSAPGAISFQVPKLLVEADGGDFDNVEVVSVGGSSSRAEALINGTIDAGVVNSVWVARLGDYDHLHVVADATSLDLLFSCIITTEKMIEERPDDLRAFLKGVLDGAKWGLTNTAEAMQISESLLPELEPALITATVNSFADRGYWNTTGIIDRSTWDFTNTTMVDAGDLIESLNYDDFVVTDLLEDSSE
jgi:NitT/TauT family transport system substrate-binding protein